MGARKLLKHHVAPRVFSVRTFAWRWRPNASSRHKHRIGELCRRGLDFIFFGTLVHIPSIKQHFKENFELVFNILLGIYEVKRILSFLSLKCISWYHCVFINIIVVIIDDLYPKQLRITDTISHWNQKGKKREGELLLFLLLILLMRLFINVVIALILLDNNLCIPLCLHFAR